MLKYLFCLFAFIAVSMAACPNVDVVSPFDVSEFLGIWYEISTSPTSLETFERNCYCTRANYTLMDDGSGDVLVQNSCNIGSISGPVQIANGTAVVEDPSEPAKLGVTFGSPFLAPYWVIINDDYQNVVVWSCTSILGIPIDYMWVLSRNNTMASSVYGSLTSKAQEITGYNTERLVLTAQQGCVYPTST